MEGKLEDLNLGHYLLELHDAARKCLNETLANSPQELGQVHQLDLDIRTWLRYIEGPEAQQLESACRELALAEYAVSVGMYRQAFASLRLFMELSFASVKFSVDELTRRRWLSDRMDFSWSNALDADAGLLSPSFVREFAPSASNDAANFAASAAASYRFCSQFVHGKSRIASDLPDAIEYAESALRRWCHHAKQAGEAVLYLLYIRYGDDFQAAEVAELSDILTSRFGHLLSMRKELGLADA